MSDEVPFDPKDLPAGTLVVNMIDMQIAFILNLSLLPGEVHEHMREQTISYRHMDGTVSIRQIVIDHFWYSMVPRMAEPHLLCCAYDKENDEMVSFLVKAMGEKFLSDFGLRKRTALDNIKPMGNA